MRVEERKGVQGTRAKGDPRGFGQGISRNIAVFSRASERNPANLPLFVVTSRTHTGHFSTRAVISLFVSSPAKGWKHHPVLNWRFSPVGHNFRELGRVENFPKGQRSWG